MAHVKLWNTWHFWSGWPEWHVASRDSVIGVSRVLSIALWIKGLLSKSRCECRSLPSTAWVKECHLLHIGHARIPVYCLLMLAAPLSYRAQWSRITKPLQINDVNINRQTFYAKQRGGGSAFTASRAAGMPVEWLLLRQIPVYLRVTARVGSNVAEGLSLQRGSVRLD